MYLNKNQNNPFARQTLFRAQSTISDKSAGKQAFRHPSPQCCYHLRWLLSLKGKTSFTSFTKKPFLQYNQLVYSSTNNSSTKKNRSLHFLRPIFTYWRIGVLAYQKKWKERKESYSPCTPFIKKRVEKKEKPCLYSCTFSFRLLRSIAVRARMHARIQHANTPIRRFAMNSKNLKIIAICIVSAHYKKSCLFRIFNVVSLHCNSDVAPALPPRSTRVALAGRAVDKLTSWRVDKAKLYKKKCCNKTQ